MNRENDIITIRIPLELRKQLAKAAELNSRSVPGMAVHFLAMGVSHLERRAGPTPPEDGGAGRTGTGGQGAVASFADTAGHERANHPQQAGGPGALSPAMGVSHPKRAHDGTCGTPPPETEAEAGHPSYGTMPGTPRLFDTGVLHPAKENNSSHPPSPLPLENPQGPRGPQPESKI